MDRSANQRGNEPPVRRRGRPIAVGLVLILSGVAMLFSPVALGRSSPVKYILMLGFLFACSGMAMLLNGLLDRKRS